MVAQTRFYSVEEFEAFVLLPENREHLYEFIGGEIVEVVSNNYSSKIAATILAEVGMYLKGKNLGDVTGADGGYSVSGERYIPDVAFIARSRQPEPSHETWNPLPPDLAVEVISPTDAEREIAVKIANYLAANTRVWLVRIPEQRISVFIPGQAVKHYSLDDVLTDDEILPGFRLNLRDVFEG